MDKPDPSFTSNQMAADRTWMAHERTLMAWVRTATSMISFGFTIDKFFEGRPPNPHAILSSRGFAMMMIGTGLISLVLATIQHLAEVWKLAKQTSHRHWSIAVLVAVMVAALGVVAFISAILNE